MRVAAVQLNSGPDRARNLEAAGRHVAAAAADGARLVVSCLDQAARAELEAVTEGRPDIQILEEEPSPAVVAACDCFVSLHCADALGLGIAEAMWLGKPVIALNAATYWHALRECGITNKVQGFGRLLAEF